VCAVSSVLDEGARQLQVQIVKADSACAVLLMLCFGAQQKRERAHVFVASKRKLAGPLFHECGARAIAAESGTCIQCLCGSETVVIMLATEEMRGCLLCRNCQVFLWSALRLRLVLLLISSWCRQWHECGCPSYG